MQRNGDSKELKELLSNVIAGELDVETNYLRNSMQAGLDEQNLKTVFQKRANTRPAIDPSPPTTFVESGAEIIDEATEGAALDEDIASSPKTERAPSDGSIHN